MHEVLGKLRGDDFLALAAFILTAVTVITLFAIWQWRKVRIAELEASLKHEMLRRGLTAEEIKHVLAAPLAAEARQGCTPSGRPLG
jgi:hypothetical protein